MEREARGVRMRKRAMDAKGRGRVDGEDGVQGVTVSIPSVLLKNGAFHRKARRYF